ncbi:MAG: hypothetical protein JWN48_4469 [Myxococcaceae bacterium]|nr:hypothetical protein [Myxococcaceae bacterium]
MRHLDDTAPTQLPPRQVPPGAPVLEPDALDPELLAINAPPQVQRVAALTIMAAAVVCAMALLISLRSDMTYVFSRTQPTDLGQVREIEPSTLVANSYVRIRGMPTVGHAIGFTRGFGTRYRVFPLAGQRTVYVQIEDTGGESFVRTEYSGRLVTFDGMGGRYAELARVMGRDAKLPVSSESFVLLADEPPSAYTWTLFVALVCAAFVLLDVYFIVRWFKPVKWAQVPASR